MNKKLLIAACGIVWNINAQEVYYFAPIIELSDLSQPTDKVGHDFGYVPSQNNSVLPGYYLWLDDQWYEIVNAKNLFKKTENGLAFYVDWARRQDLKIKDKLDVIYSYPIEALDAYKSSKEQFDQLSAVIIETSSPIKKETITNKEINVDAPIPSMDETSPLLDVLDIKEEIVREVVPFDPKTTKDVALKDSKINDSKKESKQEIISEPIPEVAVIETPKETFIIPAEIPEEGFDNPYEKAVKEGFEGSVTEWIEMVTEKKGKTPYEIALSEGYDRSETDYMRLLWGSKVNPEIDRKERDTKYVMDWIEKIKSSDGNAPYELALKHGFYGTFTEWVESVIGANGEAIYNEDVKKGYKGTYRSWVESKLKASNDELARKELLKKQNFIMVPNMLLSVAENPEEISTFSLFNYYQMYYGGSVISSNTNAQSFEIRPDEIEYQITWFNKNEITITSISPDGIIYYKKNPSYTGNSTNINVRYMIK